MKQPHFHPLAGPIDARGNCVGCAAYDPQATRVSEKGTAVAYVPKPGRPPKAKRA